MATFFPIAVIVLIMVFCVFRSRVAESGTHAEMATRLAQLRKNTDPKAFLGFCTRDEDALYFVYEQDVFFLDYELTSQQKRGHEEAFRKTAEELGFSVMDTTYGDFHVLRVKIDDSETHAAQVGFDFAKILFGHDEKTVVQFLP